MTWPFRSLRAKLLERDVALLQARIRDLEQQLVAAGDREKYFRDRYERIADVVLFRNGDTIAPVHVDPTPAKGADVGRKLLKVSTVIGSDHGVFKQPHASASELPSHVQS